VVLRFVARCGHNADMQPTKRGYFDGLEFVRSWENVGRQLPKLAKLARACPTRDHAGCAINDNKMGVIWRWTHALLLHLQLEWTGHGVSGGLS
jgi:hypothetical protein